LYTCEYMTETKDLPTNNRPDLSSDRASHDDKDSKYQWYNKKSSHESRMGLDTKIWLTVSRNVTLNKVVLLLRLALSNIPNRVSRPHHITWWRK
jgi:hypothetical protein